MAQSANAVPLGTIAPPRFIVDLDEIRAIRKRVEARAGSRGAWRRVLRRIRWGR